MNICLEPYTEKQTYEILADRAENALKPQSFHREALKQIVSSTQNIDLGLTWPRTAAKKADGTITESLIEETSRAAKSNKYIETRLDKVSSTHRQLYKITVELVSETPSKETTYTGSIYQRYQEQTQTPLSNRRISDLLKQNYEQLQPITTD